MSSKRCSQCKQTLTATDFHRSSKNKDGLRSRCKICHKANNTAYVQKNKAAVKTRSKAYYQRNKVSIGERTARRHYLDKYGLTEDEVKWLGSVQLQACAICGLALKLYVDHCHTSGLVRGLLCRECNLGLGLLRDSPVLLERAIEYLNKGGVAKGYGLERYGKAVRD